MLIYEDLDTQVDKLKLKNIITNDYCAWKFYKDYHHIYNKLWICESQNIKCGPNGIDPIEYPIIIKPIINLLGMSRGFRIIKNETEYNLYMKDGFFWMKYFENEHFNIDLIILKGKIKFYSCLKSYPYSQGTFNYHESIPNFKLPENIKKWIYKYFSRYTGCLNLEIIDNNIIEAHLRLNGDYFLYDYKFTKELDKLFNKQKWELDYNIKKIFNTHIFK